MTVGDRVQTHPCTDAWMQGDRYGEIVKLADRNERCPLRIGAVTVKLDTSGRIKRFSPSLVEVIS